MYVYIMFHSVFIANTDCCYVYIPANRFKKTGQIFRANRAERRWNLQGVIEMSLNEKIKELQHELEERKNDDSKLNEQLQLKLDIQQRHIAQIEGEKRTMQQKHQLQNDTLQQLLSKSQKEYSKLQDLQKQITDKEAKRSKQQQMQLHNDLEKEMAELQIQQRYYDNSINNELKE